MEYEGQTLPHHLSHHDAHNTPLSTTSRDMDTEEDHEDTGCKGVPMNIFPFFFCWQHGHRFQREHGGIWYPPPPPSSTLECERICSFSRVEAVCHHHHQAPSTTLLRERTRTLVRTLVLEGCCCLPPPPSTFHHPGPPSNTYVRFRGCLIISCILLNNIVCFIYSKPVRTLTGHNWSPNQ